MHRYRTPGEPDGTVLPLGTSIETHSTYDQIEEESSTTTEVYEKNREWTAVDEKFFIYIIKNIVFIKNFSNKILSTEFMRKYIHMAKAIKPKLTQAASEYISERYSELRSVDLTRTDRDRVSL